LCPDLWQITLAQAVLIDQKSQPHGRGTGIGPGMKSVFIRFDALRHDVNQGNNGVTALWVHSNSVLLQNRPARSMTPL